jgi:glycine/serine hydroxymethyltransferase
MKEAEMGAVADMIARIIKEVAPSELPEDKEERAACLKKFKADMKSNRTVGDVRDQVIALCSRFPLYPELEM